MKFRGLIGTGGVAVLLSLGAVPASATTTDEHLELAESLGVTDEGLEYLESLPEEELEDIVENQLVAEEELTVEVTPQDQEARDATEAAGGNAEEAAAVASSGCFTASATLHRSSTVGVPLYEWHHAAQWCRSDGTVTSVSAVDSWGQILGPAWTYDGRQASGSAVIGNQGRSYSQHSFTLAAGPVTIQNATPCARVIGLGTSGQGHFSTDSVCGTQAAG